jgi:hypothetical protein
MRNYRLLTLMQQNVTRSEPWDQTKLTNFIGGVMGKRARLECCRSWVHRWYNG